MPARALRNWRTTRRVTLLAGVCALVGATPDDQNWRAVPFGANAGAVQDMFIETKTLEKDEIFRYAWVFETFDTSQSPYANKKERIQFDCLRRKYRGIAWYWVDLKGHYLTTDKEDVRFNEITPDSPMDAALAFVCDPARDTPKGAPAPDAP